MTNLNPNTVLSPNKMHDSLNPEQRKAVETPLNMGVKVVAGAGTGKTWLIAHRFVKLVGDLETMEIPRPDERILAMTFTDKAAQEMRQRIDKMMRDSGRDGLSPIAAVGTFHTFCQRLLREQALFAGLSPDFSLIEGLTRQVIFNRLIEGITHWDFENIAPALAQYQLTDIPADIFSKAFLETVDPQALRLFELSTLLETFPSVIDRIKSAGLSPAEFRMLTKEQTRRLTEGLRNVPHCGAGELLESNEAYCDVWSQYLTSWRDQNWDFHGEFRGYQDDKVFQDQLAWFNKHKWDTDRDYPYACFNRGKSQPGTGDFSRLEQVHDLEHTLIDMAAAFYALYQYTLRKENCCDFDDLINLCVELLETNAAIREEYRDRYRTIIVDEFQDSNGSQLKLLQQLMSPDIPNITVVGDFKQSIYGFRFAQPENLELIFKGRDPNTICEVPLKTNYRSCPPVLEAANRLCPMIAAGDQTLTPCPDKTGQKSPNVQWLTLGQPDETIDPIRQREALWIAAEAARLIGEEGYQPADIMVLVKKHTTAETIQRALRAMNIPAVKSKNQGFFQEPVILDAIALLQLLHNPYQDGPWIRILQKKLSQRQLRLLSDLRKHEHERLKPDHRYGLYNILQQLSDASVCPALPLHVRHAVAWLVKRFESIHQEKNRFNWLRQFSVLSDSIGLIPVSNSPDERVEKSVQISAFRKLLFDLQRNDQHLQTGLPELLDILEDLQSGEQSIDTVSNSDATSNAVQIMTIHGAKGLEQKVVFVAYCNSTRGGSHHEAPVIFDPQYEGKNGFGLLLRKVEGAKGEKSLKAEVHKKTWENPRREAEEKRLFYVALTRAEERLYIINAQQSAHWTQPDIYQNDMLEAFSEIEHPDFFADYFSPERQQQLKEAVTQNLKTSSATPLITQLTETEQDVPAVIPTSITVSFSDIRAWESCPVKHYLQHVSHLPAPPNTQEENNTAMRQGECLHKLIQKHYARHGELSEDAIGTHIENSLGDLPESTRKETLAAYRQFNQSEYAYHALTKAGYTLESEKRMAFAFNETINVTGIMDLLLYHSQSQTYTIIDFKTNRTIESLEKNKDSYGRQLRLYEHGVSRLWPKHSCNLKLVHITPDSLETHPVENQPAPDLLRVLESIHQSVASGQFPKRSDNADCKRCDYEPVCPSAVCAKD